MQQFLPNTYPGRRARIRVPTCPVGLRLPHVERHARSRHAGQFQLRRRLRNGFTATVQYTLAKATDDAAAFSGASLSGAAIAQDWLDSTPSAAVELRSASSVDGAVRVHDRRRRQRRRAARRLKGALVKDWTVTSQLTAGSGLPLTPVYLTSVRGTGVTGTIRADLTGASDRRARRAST